MKNVSVHVLSLPTKHAENAYLLFPKPFDDWVEECTAVELKNLIAVEEIQATNANQTAYLAKADALKTDPVIRYTFSESAQKAPADGFWNIQENRYTTASADLVELVRSLFKERPNPSQSHPPTSSHKKPTHAKIRALIEHAAEIFSYGHEDQRFNDAMDEVPSLCGTTKGSCVDINTYLIAAARSLNIPVQYIAGYWFHPEKTETADMHCWLAFLADGEPLFWDLAHHLKWGVNPLNPGLNPAGGRRVPMSYGRGLAFKTPHGSVQISHFSEPVWVLPEGQLEEAKVLIGLEES